MKAQLDEVMIYTDLKRTTIWHLNPPTFDVEFYRPQRRKSTRRFEDISLQQLRRLCGVIGSLDLHPDDCRSQVDELEIITYIDLTKRRERISDEEQG